MTLETERIQSQLVRWGFSRRVVERMSLGSILSCYSHEKSKRENILCKVECDSSYANGNIEKMISKG